jgi:hypothetical protein
MVTGLMVLILDVISSSEGIRVGVAVGGMAVVLDVTVTGMTAVGAAHAKSIEAIRTDASRRRMALRKACLCILITP